MSAGSQAHPLTIWGREASPDASDAQWIVLRTRRRGVRPDDVGLLALRLREILSEPQRLTLATALQESLEPRGDAPWTVEEEARLRRWWTLRVSASGIADALGRSEAEVRRYATACGLPSRRGSGPLRKEVPQ